MLTAADIRFVHLGLEIEHLRNSISVFGFRIAFYGIIIGIGMLAGIWIAQSDARRRGQDPDLYLDFAWSRSSGGFGAFTFLCKCNVFPGYHVLY